MREITPAEAAALPIVDVREPHEWQAGHADGAIHIPMTEIVARVAEVPDGAAIICRSGARSAQVVAYLAQQGLDAANVEGGTLRWAAEGRPMTGPVV
ncbi:rhodanese-like domain-containing protein [Agrococcus sediminis]|jgi:rhodanese-related sulfurtransferase|uniref:rhodanese-like domain-containing protein n=1 Tax=Agrococcus TaxID=46352 RepID=UPI001FF2589F|nr:MULTISPECIES: rhodanese-like domain-containing protein [unclassified Agrococcus]MDR7234310.1 rhodanese-related sulfurtransferase [Agrococcus sp. BE272]UOW00810.1 rhodanese-like domain-containing protein [Agrococcus sp. SCSIO52902]UOW00872.1 rhodanese-like domain-containing protein [Agrococcus sp. SCSIO52902]